MNLEQIIKTDNEFVIHTYNRKPVSFVRGTGTKLYDTEDKEYIDFLAGIAVSAVGHSHPVLTSALKNQIDKVIHTSNLYYIEPQAKLAQKICQSTCAKKVFFSNSGAEANEGAIKLAKIYHYKNNHPEKIEIITLQNSFHGRTLATIASTGQQKYQKPYCPLTPSFIHVPMNDIEILKSTITPETAAIMLELVQGESGVHPVDKEYVKQVRQICDENDIILIVDEVQTGMGRTGKFMAYEHFDIKPDIFTLAKALGGGVPVGAVCAGDKLADYFEYGEHGSTFGGNFLATAAGNAIFDIFEQENLVENSYAMGQYFLGKLKELEAKTDKIKEVRGIGLMLGVELKESNANQISDKLFDNGFLIGTVAGKILRFLPPLIISKDDIDKLVACLETLL